ncbi:MAG: MFS transporter [Gammaproteobacteria bacterium]
MDTETHDTPAPPLRNSGTDPTTTNAGETVPSRGRLLTLSWAHFLNDGAANYLPGVLPAVLLQLNIPVAFAGTVMAALLLGQALQPLYGWLSDHIGGRRLIFIGIAGTTAGGALVGLVPGYWSLIAVLLLIGFTNAMFHPQGMAATRQLAHQRARAQSNGPGAKVGLFMSVFLVGGELGRGIWPLLASLVVVALGTRGLWILALPMVLTLPLLIARVPKLAPRHRDAGPVAWRRHLPDLARVVSFSALRATLTFSLVTFVPLLWHQRGESLISGASLITTLLVVGIVGNMSGGHWADRIGRRPVLLLSTVASAVLLAGFLLAPPVLAWPLLALLGVAMFASLPLAILMGQDILPENPSLGSGLALGLANALGALTVMLLGLLVDDWGIAAILWLNVGFSIVTALMVPFLPEGSQPRPSRAV